ncbi:MAG: hypothetical protein CMJ31_08000 [Phycisphaerae bacterium]|nr:hypothetical protein [Phycisphaerae bacterium]
MLKALAATFLAVCIPLIAGCPYETQALFDDERDYDRRVSLDRLRRVRTLDLPNAAVEPTAMSPDEERARIASMRAKFEEEPEYELIIEQARAAVLENNLDLRVALINPAIAAETLNEEEGRFDSVLFANAQVNDNDAAVATALEAGESQSIFVSPGLRVPLRTGGTFQVSAPFTRRVTDNQFTFLNPNYSQDVEFSLSHPLLRGAGRRATMYQVRVADLDRQASEARTKLEVIRQVAAADRAYWRLYAAREELLVRLQQYELAFEQRERAQRRFDAGAVAEIEIFRAESGAADRIEQIIRADNNVLLQQRELKRLLNIPGLDVDTEVDIVTSSDPDPVPYLLDGSALADEAMAQRMELLEIELNLARDAATVAFSENQALPLLSLDYTYRVDGLGQNFEEAVRVASENRFESWQLGVTAEIPLGNQQRKAAVERAVLTRLQRLATQSARRQTIRKEVLDAVDTIESGWQRIRAAQEAVRLNTRTLEAETRQFNVGRSNSIDVLDADANLAQARLTEIQAVVDYQIAQIDLAFATGTLLGASKIEWGPLDPRRGDVVGPEVDTAPVDPEDG